MIGQAAEAWVTAACSTAYVASAGWRGTSTSQPAVTAAQGSWAPQLGTVGRYRRCDPLNSADTKLPGRYRMVLTADVHDIATQARSRVAGGTVEECGSGRDGRAIARRGSRFRVRYRSLAGEHGQNSRRKRHRILAWIAAGAMASVVALVIVAVVIMLRGARSAQRSAAVFTTGAHPSTSRTNPDRPSRMRHTAPTCR